MIFQCDRPKGHKVSGRWPHGGEAVQGLRKPCQLQGQAAVGSSVKLKRAEEKQERRCAAGVFPRAAGALPIALLLVSRILGRSESWPRVVVVRPRSRLQLLVAAVDRRFAKFVREAIKKTVITGRTDTVVAHFSDYHGERNYTDEQCITVRVLQLALHFAWPVEGSRLRSNLVRT